jgi:prepilin-type N-terminal cleavage/methylation domain-containing protein
MRGFTLIELMVVVTIAATLMFIAAPDFTLFVANQRIRSVTSDLYHDLTHARAQAIALNRRVCLVPAAGGLTDGWTIVSDISHANPDDPANNGCLDVGDEVLTSSGPTPARTQILPNPAASLPTAANPLTFLPNGEVMLQNPLPRGTPVAFRGLTVCDNLGDSDVTNNKVRTIFFGLTGRMRVEEHRLDPTGGGVCL